MSNDEECKFLTRGNGKSGVAIPYMMDDEKSCYYYFDYNDGAYITQIVLNTDIYHVFDIRVGGNLSTVDDILKNQGYVKKEIDASPKKNWPVASFEKNYISISFCVDPDIDIFTITSIIINAQDPKYAGIDY